MRSPRSGRLSLRATRAPAQGEDLSGEAGYAAEVVESALPAFVGLPGADEEERDEYGGSFDDWPAHVDIVLEQSEARRDDLLSCFWSSSPGSSSADGLVLIGLEERAYLCFWDDWGEGHRAIACLQPGFDQAVVDDVVEQVLVSNGHDFGVWVFGSPPDEISANVSDEVLTRAFVAMRDHHDDYGEWAEYVDSHAARQRAGS